MDLMLQTPAELLRAAGWMPPVAVDASAREVVLMLGSTFLDHTLVRFEHQRETAHAEDPFVFSLRNPNDAEQMMWDGTSLPEMPKMALARRLEVLHGRNRMECFNSMSKIMMITTLDHTYIAPVPAAPKKGGGGRKSKAAGGKRQAESRKGEERKQAVAASKNSEQAAL